MPILDEDDIEAILNAEPSPPELTQGVFENAKEGAKSGDPIYLYILGCVYDEGLLTARDVELAEEYFLRAAGGGLTMARGRLGLLYLSMDDTEDARIWLEIAAKHADGRAAHNLACLLKKEGDTERALYWFEDAATNMGSTLSANVLGDYFAEQDDWNTACQWYEVAAKVGNDYAKIMMIKYYEATGDVLRVAYWQEYEVEQP